MKTFLVPFDFSPAAEDGLKYAVYLAGKMGAEVILLHVNEAEEDMSRNVKEKTAIRLLAKCQELSDKYKVPIHYCIEKGNPVDIIPKVARVRMANLIIMGSANEVTLSKILLGGNTEGVVANARVPVLMIPEGTVFGNIRRIVFATDFHSSDIDDLKEQVQLAAAFKAQINVLHIYHDDMKDHWHRDEMKKFMNEVLSRLDYNEISFEMIEGDQVVERMKEYLDSGAADILALSTHSRNYWDKLFRSSFTDEILYRSSVPVLVYHYKRDAGVKLF